MLGDERRSRVEGGVTYCAAVLLDRVVPKLGHESSVRDDAVVTL
jgi:hypothetical protein